MENILEKRRINPFVPYTTFLCALKKSENRKGTTGLRIQITFSLAPATMKISLSQFNNAKYIYLNRRITFLSMVPIKIKNERFWRKKLSNTFMTVEV